MSSDEVGRGCGQSSTVSGGVGMTQVPDEGVNADGDAGCVAGRLLDCGVDQQDKVR